MKSILSLFVKYPFYGKVIIAMFLLVGGVSIYSIKKSSLPIVESKKISISVSYQGATPKEMDEGVTSLIEEAIRGTVGIKEFTSSSAENSASVTVTVLNDYDVDEVLADVKNVVDGISNFPSAAEKPVVSKSRTVTIAMFLEVLSKNGDLYRLKNEAQKIEDDFLASGKISQITIYGYPSRMEMSIEVKEDMLRRYSITFDEIQSAVSQNNLDIYGGEIKNVRERIKINSRYRSTEVHDIEDIVVRANSNGTTVKVKDVARVVYQFEDTPSSSYTDGAVNVVFRIDKLASEDLEELSGFVNDYVETYNIDNEDVEMRIGRDFLDTLEGQLSILYSNGGVGILLVVISLSLFLSFRLSLWVAWGIPASFLGMFFIAALSGVTINMISVFGMILIIGILVDDGIVIGENIFTHFEMGKTPRRAAIDGTLEVMPAVLTSVSTTIIAFLPLFYIEGNLEMMYEMGFVVVFCLLFSLFEGLFVLPSHLASESVLKPLDSSTRYGKIRCYLDKIIFSFRDKIYIRTLRWILSHKLITASIVIVMFAVTGGLLAGGRIGMTFYPATSEDTFVIDLTLKPGVNEDVTKELLFEIEQQVYEVNRELAEEFGEEEPIDMVMVWTGSAFSRTESGTNCGNMRVFLRRMEKSKMDSHIIKRRIAEKVGDIPQAYKFAVGASNRFGAPVAISLMGRDNDQLAIAVKDLERELKEFESLYNITNNSQLGGQEIRLKLKPEAYALGLTQQSLLAQVRQAFYGGLAQRIQEGKDEIWFYVRYPDSDRRDIGDLENMIINTTKGSFPLESLATVSTDRSLTKINHYNGKTEITVSAYLKDADDPIIPILEKVEADVIPKILAKYKGVSFMHQGQQKDTTEQMGSIVFAFGGAFLIIILIIMIYFRSFTQGMMIIAMIPFGVMVALWGHGIEGKMVSIMSLWGIIALSGTIINDAVVFLSRYNQNLVRGFDVMDSIFEAAKSRFRPIMLTTITTTVGLFPLVKETSNEAALIIPMAISLAYGILLGTTFILLILPLFIVVTNSMKVKFQTYVLGRSGVTPESVETAVKDHQIELKLQSAMAREIEDTREVSDIEM